MHNSEIEREIMKAQVNEKMKRTAWYLNDLKVAEKNTMIPIIVISLEYIILMLVLSQITFSLEGITLFGDWNIDIFSGFRCAYYCVIDNLKYIVGIFIATAVMEFYLVYKKVHTKQEKFVFKKKQFYWWSAVITATYYSWQMIEVNDTLLDFFGITNILMGANMFTGYAVLFVNWIVFMEIFVMVDRVCNFSKTKLK